MTTETLWARTKKWLQNRSERPGDKAKIGRIRLRKCRDIPGDLENGDKSRYYSHAGHKKGYICISDDFSDLAGEYQTGILAHEVGHILSGLTDEPSADLYMLDNFRIRIKYKGPKELQYVNLEEICK